MAIFYPDMAISVIAIKCRLEADHISDNIKRSVFFNIGVGTPIGFPNLIYTGMK